MGDGGGGGGGTGGLGPSAGPPGVPGGASPGGAPGPGIGGVSGPDGGGGVGGGPGNFPSPPVAAQLPVQQQAPPPPVFTINPNQVQNDLDLGGQWGGQSQMPQMNPFSMYGSPSEDKGNAGMQRYMHYVNMGSALSPFNWKGYFGNFGGK